MTTLTDTQVITASGGLVELGYSEIPSNVTVASSTAGSGTPVISPLTVVCDGGPVLVEFFSPAVRPTVGAGNNLVISLYQDGAEKSRSWAFVKQSDVNANNVPVHLSYRTTPTAGSHTFDVRAYNSTGSTGLIEAGSATTAAAPAFLRVSKIVQATQWPAVTTGTIICTSSTRPASPFEGQKIWETDTSKEYTYTGSAWIQTGPPPRRLARVTRDSQYTVVSSLSGGEVFSSDLSFTADGTSTYRVEFFCGSVQNLTAGTGTTVYLTDGGNNAITRLTQHYEQSANGYGPSHAVHYVTPSAGTVTYNVKAVGATNSYLQAGSGSGDNFPIMFLQVFGPDLT